MKLLCINCQKEVAKASNVEGITTWFAICSECMFGVKGWTKKELEEFTTNPVGGRNDQKKPKERDFGKIEVAIKIPPDSPLVGMSGK